MTNRNRSKFMPHRRKLFGVWKHMHRRTKSTLPRHRLYAGRKVCQEWQGYSGWLAFKAFALEHGWKPGLFIDRIDNHGDYEPSNVRFVTASLSSRNTSRNRIITICGRTKNLVEWAEIVGSSSCPSLIYHKIQQRLRYLWPPDEAVFGRVPKIEFNPCAEFA